jgi:WD40 repeat protein
MYTNQVLKTSAIALISLWTSFTALNAQLEVNSYYVSGNGVSESVYSKSTGKFYSSDNYSTIRVYELAGTEAVDQFEAPFAEVKAIDIDPTGNYLLVAGKDGGLSIMDLKSKNEKVALKSGSTDYFYNARFSFDGKKVVAANLDTNVYIFNTATGGLEKKFRGPSEIWIWAMVFDKNLNWFVAGGSDGKTEMYDSKGVFYKKINGFTSTIWSADASPDNKEFVIGAWDNTLKVYEFGCAYQRLDIKNGDQWVYSVKYSPDGKYILSGDATGVLRLWSNVDGKFNSAYQAHSSTIEDIRFSPDGKYVITSGADGYMKVLNYDSLKTPTDDVYAYGYDDYNYDETNYDDNNYNYNPVYDGSYLYASYSMYGQSGAINDFDFNSDGDKFATAEYSYTSGIYNTADGSYLTGSYYQQSNTVNCVAFEPKGTKAAYAGEDMVITIYDVNDGQTLNSLSGHTSTIYGLKWTTDGKIVSGSNDYSIKIWDAEKGTELKTLTGHADYIWDLDVDSKNKTIVSGAASGELFLWDLKTGKIKTRIAGLTGSVYDCSFSQDGKYIVAGSLDGQVGLFDAKGKSKWIATNPSNTLSYATAISPDNKYVFAGDNYGNVFVYDASSGLLKKTVYASTVTINAIKFTKDKKNIAIADDAGIVAFFNYDEFIQ